MKISLSRHITKEMTIYGLMSFSFMVICDLYRQHEVVFKLDCIVGIEKSTVSRGHGSG